MIKKYKNPKHWRRSLWCLMQCFNAECNEGEVFDAECNEGEVFNAMIDTFPKQQK